MIGMKELATPNRIAPLVLANIKSSNEIGASNRRSKEWFFFSNVTVTASMEVVPKRMVIAITPGKSVRAFSKP